MNGRSIVSKPCATPSVLLDPRAPLALPALPKVLSAPAGRAPWLPAALLAALLAGCSATPLEINRSGVTSGGLDATYRFTLSGAGGIQLQVEGYRAASTQHLGAGSTVSIDQRTMTGPLDIRNEATVRRAFLGYNHQVVADRPVRLQWFAGAGWTSVRWSSTDQSSAPQTSERSLSGVGPMGGVLGSWQITPLLALEAGVFGQAGWMTDAHAVDWSQTETGLALSLAPSLRLRAGWAKRSLRASSSAGDVWQSDLTADTRGPYVKLAFEFR